MMLLRGSASSWPASAHLRCVVTFLLGCLFCWTPLAVLSQSCDGAPNADTCPCVVFIPPAGESQPTVTGGPACESNGASGQLYFTCYDWDRLQTLLATYSASCDQIATVRFSGGDYNIESVVFSTPSSGTGAVAFIGAGTRLVAAASAFPVAPSIAGQPGRLLTLLGFSMVLSRTAHTFSYVAILGATEWRISQAANSGVVSFMGGEINDACSIVVLAGGRLQVSEGAILGQNRGGPLLDSGRPRVWFAAGPGQYGSFQNAVIYSSERSPGVGYEIGAQLTFSGCLFEVSGPVSNSPQVTHIRTLVGGLSAPGTSVTVNGGSIARGPSYLFWTTDIGSSLSVSRSTLRGSGIKVEGGGALTVSESTLDGQGFATGVEIRGSLGRLQLLKSTVTGYGTALKVDAGASVTSDTSTIANNGVAVLGQGLDSFSARFTTIVGNTGGGLYLNSPQGSVNLEANLISGNGGNCILLGQNLFSDGGGNVVERDSQSNCQFDTTRNYYSSGPPHPLAPDPFAIGPLRKNGGPTDTMVPASTSKAINFVPCSGGSDQRGRPRTGDFCDAGAVETNSDSGGLDPHFELPSLLPSDSDSDVEVFSFDFHGEAGRSYCMISDGAFAVNTHMVGLSPDAQIIQRPVDEQDPFFEGTWMDGLGFLYLDPTGRQQNVTVSLAPTSDEFSENPFLVTFGNEAINFTDATWRSPDEQATLELLTGRVATLLLSLKGLLDMEISRGFEEDLIVEPPVQFLNLEIRGMTHSPDVHGFLGQMYQPHAAETRFAMGTLEGLRHREYVEGTDEEYLTSSLTIADCSFNRFKRAGHSAEASYAPPQSNTVARKVLSSSIPQLQVASKKCALWGKGAKIGCK